MRSSADIQKQIDEMAAKDKAYNNLVNEGGEGYEINSLTKELINELAKAQEREFWVEWTKEFYEKKRAIFQEAVSKIGEPTIANFLQAQKITGIRLDHLQKCRKHYIR